MVKLSLLPICATIQATFADLWGNGMKPWRVGVQLGLLALNVLLFSLVPYPLAFTGAMRQANALYASGEYSAVLDAYQEAADLDPRSPLPWLRMGEVFLDRHRFVEAAAAFRQAQQRGGGGEALLGLGASLAGRGDWAAAMQIWLQVLALEIGEPGTAHAYVALGQASVAQGRFDQAADYLNHALQLEPALGDTATAHRLLGRLLAYDDPDRAAAHLRQTGDADMLAVLEAAGSAGVDPARRALVLGAAFLQRGELALARREFERAAALAPGDAEAHAYLAHTLDRLGETAAAGELLAQALALDADSALAYYFLGTHHRLVGNVTQAREALWQALQRDPENAALRVEMAETFVDLGDYARAEEWYLGAVEVAPTDVEFRLLLAHFYLDHLYHVAEGGVPAAETVVTLAPEDARARDLLGWAYHLAGRHAEGRQSLQQALALDPDLVSAYYHLGSLYASTGRHTLAREHLQRAIDLDTEGYYRQRAEALLDDLE